MDKNEKIKQAVFRAIDSINETIPAKQRIDKRSDFILYGPSGRLDSLGLCLFIVAIEKEVANEFKRPISITGGYTSYEHNPFGTVGSLLGYLFSIIKEGE